MSEGGKESEGWGWPLQSKKAHYFVGARSLCNGWLYGGTLEAASGPSPDDCARCTKLLTKRIASLTPDEPTGGARP